MDPPRDSGVDSGPSPESDGADAALVDSPTPDGGVSCDPSMPFGPRRLVPGLLSTLPATWISGLRLSPDYLTGYFFASGRPGIDLFRLYTAARDTPTSPFKPATPLESGLGMQVDQVYPTLSNDGLTLIFEGRSVGGLPTHLFYETRAIAAMPFSHAGPVPNADDSGANDATPFLREDGAVLYFSSDRGTPGDLNIYRASWTGAGLGSPVSVAELNTTFTESHPVVTPDDRTVYFSRARPGAIQQVDIWVATRALPTDDFSIPTHVTELGSDGMSVTPTFVTRDGCTLYFESHDGPPPTEYFAEKSPK